MTFEEILAEAKKICGRMEWHSFRAVPGEHRFGTYNIPKRTLTVLTKWHFTAIIPLKLRFSTVKASRKAILREKRNSRLPQRERASFPAPWATTAQTICSTHSMCLILQNISRRNDLWQ